MDKSAATVTATPKGGALRALIEEGQALLGCPDWCSWSVSHPRHEHSTTTGAELVIEEQYDEGNDEHVLVLLEARHGAAPAEPETAGR